MKEKLAYVVLGLVALALVKMLAGTSSVGMALFFVVLFGWLKPLVGFTTWWHAIAAAGIASGLYAIYPRMVSVGSAGEWLILRIVAALLTGGFVVALWSRQRRQQAS
jgi:hypothetical protein